MPSIDHAQREGLRTLMSYMATMETRLLERTRREYAVRLREMHRQMGAHQAMQPHSLVDQVARAVETGMAASTFRLQKAAAMFWLGQQAQAVMAAGGDIGAYAAAYDALRAIRYRNTAPVARTSARKLRQFPAEAAAAVSEYARVNGHRSGAAVRADAFVRANLLVGLRPSEWLDTALVYHLPRGPDGGFLRGPGGRLLFEVMLVVPNAKASHGRANGPQRELILYGATAEQVADIAVWWDMVRRFQDQRDPAGDRKSLTTALYAQLNVAIRRALTASGFSARDIPSLYSTRHQVMADFKASGHSPQAIAAFFGHASIHTHRAHYGHKRHGRGRVTFAASPESLARVINRRAMPRSEIVSPGLADEARRWVEDRDARKEPDR